MKYIVLCSLFIISFQVKAAIIENKEPAILEVHYIKTSMSDTLVKRCHSDPMTLRVGRTSAMFYPTRKMWADSLSTTNFALHEKILKEMNPEGQKEYKPIGGLESEYVFRNIHDGETMVFRTIGGDLCSYAEPTECPVWTLKSETKNILGYSCQLATCYFRGRIWNVWFTPDIPVKEGPWKLFGLPGLILEASDSKNHYTYKAVSLSTKNLQPVGIKLYIRNKPFKLKDRQQYLQRMYKAYIKREFINKMRALYGGNTTKPDRTYRQYDFQETDYKHE